MAKFFILAQAFLVFILSFKSTTTNAQSLGKYPNTTVTAGQNTIIAPDMPPSGITSIVAFTNTNYSGVFTVDPVTGNVRITNAKKAGIYPVTVKAFGSDIIVQSFILTITNPICTNGGFQGTTEVGVGSTPNALAIGDFNGDGIQDVATADNGTSNRTIRIGNGEGSFTGPANTGNGCRHCNSVSIAVGDFNGDGKQDIAKLVTGVVFGSVLFIELGDGEGNFISTFNYSVDGSEAGLVIGDFNNDGIQDIAASSSNNRVSIWIGNGLGGFSKGAFFSVGSSPHSLGIGDFNKDGNQDIASANYISNNVSIRLGDGLGGFSAGSEITVGNRPASIAIGDFNGDDKQDFATANYTSNTVSIRLGDGMGGFEGDTEVSVGTSPYCIALGDFNGDGQQDFCTANYGSSNVSVRLGNGMGSFTSTNDIEVGSKPRFVATGDFNNDGIHDFITANSGSNNVSIRLGVPILANTINLKGNNINILNGDNSPSVSDHTDFGVVSPGNSLEHTFTILNTGSSALVINSIRSSNPHFLVGSFSDTILANSSANFTLTFSPEIPNIENANITIVTGNCSGIFKFAVTGKTAPPVLGKYPDTIIMAGENIAISPTAAPINTKAAIAYTHSNFTGLLTIDPASGIVTITNAKQAGTYEITVKAFGEGTSYETFSLKITNPACSDGLFNQGTNVAVGSRPSALAIGDFNNDGNQDFVSTNWGNGNCFVSVNLGNGSGGFSSSPNIGLPSQSDPLSIAIGDFNRDGKQDFITANQYTNNVSIKLGDGLGGFTGSENVSVGSGPLSVAIGDFNQDGKQDFVTANQNSNNVSIRMGDGLGSFSGGTDIVVGLSPFSVSVGDFNNDGKMDFATANQNSNNVSILLGDGLGGFEGHTISVGIQPRSLAIGDFNGDGNQDFITASLNSQDVSIRMGDGLGGFSDKNALALGANPQQVAIGDFNGDGNQDIAISCFQGKVLLRMGNGKGEFTGNTEIELLPNPLYGIVIGDFNGDGRHDFATSHIFSNSVSIQLGDGSGSVANTWLGNTADWNLPANWSTGIVPGNCTQVVINSGVPFLPTITGLNNSCFSLLLMEGTSVNMAPGAKLNITGKLK